MSTFLRSLLRAIDRGRIMVPVAGLQLSVRRDAKLVAIVEEDSRVPLWLLANAKAAATHNCRVQTASEWDGFIALTAVCTAAEALVNRLLEPLVSANDWDGAGRKSIERWPLPDKWVKLSTILNTAPVFTLATEPVLSFKKVIEARNNLVHFKHGKNVRRFETEKPFRLGDPLPSAEDIARHGPRKVLQEGNVEPTLAPSLAASYYEAFERVLLPILEKCARTPVADVAGRIRETLDIADAAIRREEGATIPPPVQS